MKVGNRSFSKRKWYRHARIKKLVRPFKVDQSTGMVCVLRKGDGFYAFGTWVFPSELTEVKP